MPVLPVTKLATKAELLPLTLDHPALLPARHGVHTRGVLKTACQAVENGLGEHRELDLLTLSIVLDRLRAHVVTFNLN